MAKVRANIVIHICSSIAWQAGAQPVSQPPAPGTEPQPMIRTACAYNWRQARHFFAIDKTCHSLAMLAGQRLELAISVCSTQQLRGAHSMDGNDLIVSFGEVICAWVGCSARAGGPFGLAPAGRTCPRPSLLAGVGRDRRWKSAHPRAGIGIDDPSWPSPLHWVAVAPASKGR